MTPDALRALSEAELARTFAALIAGPPLVGEYDGQAWSHTSPRLVGLLGLVWTGKRFDDGSVVNRVGGLWLIRGDVATWHNETIINYGWLGLVDTIRWANGCYLGRMELFCGAVWFTLTKSSQP